MAFDFRTPPSWPPAPPGWRPPPDWAPDPSWPPAPAGWAFWQRRPPSALRRARASIALGGGTVALAIAVSTLLPGAPWTPGPAVAVAFVLVFPIFGSVVIEGSRAQAAQRVRRGAGQSRWDPARQKPAWAAPPSELGGSPGWAKATIGTIAFALWWVAGSGIVLIKGQPEKVNGGYYANNHGSLTPLTHAGYLHEQALQDRIFSGGAAIFLLVAAILTWRDLPWPGPSAARHEHD